MNKRIKNIVTVVLLAAFLFGFGAWAALKPADSLSLSERRRLKQLHGRCAQRQIHVRL